MSSLGKGWPLPDELQHYFLAPPEHRWTFDEHNSDCWGLNAEGVANEQIAIGAAGVGQVAAEVAHGISELGNRGSAWQRSWRAGRPRR